MEMEWTDFISHYLNLKVFTMKFINNKIKYG